MSSTIQRALRNQAVAGLEDVQRGEQGLTCCVCGGRLRVCDGKGERVKGRGRRNVPRGKYFAHVSGGGCNGEGMVHYALKTLFAKVINERRDDRAGFRGMPYVCPSLEYAPNCTFKHAPGQDAMNLELEGMDRGHHYFDLLKNLHEAKCEHWLGGRATRADLAGLDRNGAPLWVIEIKRTNISDKAVAFAKSRGYPLFVVDVTNLPAGDDTAEQPVMLNGSMDFYIIMENALRGGFLPRAVETYNTGCDREAFGMGPEDHHWRRDYAYVNGEQVLLHECGGKNLDDMMCPDVRYMMENEIGPAEMYTDPIHLVQSHTHTPVMQAI